MPAIFRIFLCHWLLGLALACGIAGCAALRFQQPTVNAGTVKLTALDFRKADLAVALQITNPNPSTLVIAGYSYDLQVESQPFLAGASETEFELKPKEVSLVTVPVLVNFSDLTEKLNTLKGKPDAGYRLTVALGVKTPVGTYPLTFHKEGRIPVLTMPQIRLRSVRVGSKSPQGLSLEAIVEVSDPSPSVKLAALSYALTVNGVQLTDGSDERPQPSPGGDGHLVRIPIPLDPSKARSLLGPLVLGTEQPTFTLTGQATFSSPLGPIALPFTHSQKIKPGR